MDTSKQSRRLTHGLLGLAVCWISSSAVAQSIAINNVRILDGTGRIIERGSVLIQHGTIARVARESLAADLSIDAEGLTAIPGLIDTHVHLITGPEPDYGCEQVIDNLDETLLGLLQRGFTTIMSTGDPMPDIQVLRERIQAGDVTAPQLLISGPVFRAPGHPSSERVGFCNSAVVASDEESARAGVRELAMADVDAVKILLDSRPPVLEDRVVGWIVSEAHARSIPVMAHVQTVDEAVRAVRLGVDRLVHVPHLGLAEPAALAVLANTPMSSTLHLHAPIYRAGAPPVNHGEREYPQARLQAAEVALEEKLRLLRTFWSSGAPIAFGTDAYRGQPMTQDAWAHELETLAKELSPGELVATLTLNAAKFLGKGAELGSLEPGKAADVVLVEGDPLADVSALAAVAMVIADGVIVFDAR